MDSMILDSGRADRRYECFGSGRRSCILSCGKNEARFWHSLGYVVLHFSDEAERTASRPAGDDIGARARANALPASKPSLAIGAGVRTDAPKRSMQSTSPRRG